MPGTKSHYRSSKFTVIAYYFELGYTVFCKILVGLFPKIGLPVGNSGELCLKLPNFIERRKFSQLISTDDRRQFITRLCHGCDARVGRAHLPQLGAAFRQSQ